MHKTGRGAFVAGWLALATWWLLLWISFWCLLPATVVDRGLDGQPAFPSIAVTYTRHIQPRFLPGWPSAFAVMLLASSSVLVLLAGLLTWLRFWLRPLTQSWLLAWLVVEGAWWWLWLESLAIFLTALLVGIVPQQEDLARNFDQTFGFRAPAALARWLLSLCWLWFVLLLAGLWWRWRVLRRRLSSPGSVPAAAS